MSLGMGNKKLTITGVYAICSAQITNKKAHVLNYYFNTIFIKNSKLLIISSEVFEGTYLFSRETSIRKQKQMKPRANIIVLAFLKVHFSLRKFTLSCPNAF
jgi:hypothetical protein